MVKIGVLGHVVLFAVTMRISEIITDRSLCTVKWGMHFDVGHVAGHSRGENVWISDLTISFFL